MIRQQLIVGISVIGSIGLSAIVFLIIGALVRLELLGISNDGRAEDAFLDIMAGLGITVTAVATTWAAGQAFLTVVGS